MSFVAPMQQTTSTPMHPPPNPTHPLGDLNNHVHIIFARGKFELDDPNDYELLRPSLQLASKLIQEPSLLGMWHTAFHGAAKRIEHVLYPLPAERGDDEKEKEHWEYTNHFTQLTEEQIRELRWSFLKLSGRVRFRMYDEDSFEARRAERTGGQLTVSVPRVKMEELRRVTAAHAGVKGLFEHAVVAWTLAVGLCHELMHVVNFIVHAIRPWKHFFFPGFASSETGFDWENEIFGGRVDAQDLSHPFVLPWPNPIDLEQYLRHGSTEVAVRLAHSAAVLPERNAEDGEFVVVRHRVLPGFFEQFFEQRFWDGEVARRGADALRVQPWAHYEGEFVMTNDVLSKLVQTYTDAKAQMESCAGEDPASIVEFQRLCRPWEEFLSECCRRGIWVEAS